MTTTAATRAERAKMHLALARASKEPAKRDQHINDWLYYATSGEVRRNWPKRFGQMPLWAAERHDQCLGETRRPRSPIPPSARSTA